VPLWFRQRIYRRFRSLLADHLAHLLRSGASAEAVMPGLAQLVAALGVASFEADYIRIEAESRISHQETPRPDFAQLLREAQASYRGRVRTLESMTELDTETREQLMEQEHVRFQQQLRSVAGNEVTGHELIVICAMQSPAPRTSLIFQPRVFDVLTCMGENGFLDTDLIHSHFFRGVSRRRCLQRLAAYQKQGLTRPAILMAQLHRKKLLGLAPLSHAAVIKSLKF
jgi:hypothetical protein